MTEQEISEEIEKIIHHYNLVGSKYKLHEHIAYTLYKKHKQALINNRIEGAIREIVRLTILMSDGTSAEEYQKALSILHKEKIMLREELRKEKTNG